MSSSKDFLDSKRSGKAPEKSNFASTCNLLSQYVKEKGKLKDLSRPISGNLKTTGKSDASQIKKQAMETKNLLSDLNQPPTIEELTTPIDELPPPSGQMVFPISSEEFTNKAITSNQTTKIESKSAQMTILFDGKIFVFDDLPADKAYELMTLATKGNTITPSNGDLYTSAQKHNNLDVLTLCPSAQQEKRSLTNGKEIVKELPDDDSNSDLPIARRSSLQRILEKRKERMSTRGPYPVDRDSLKSHIREDEGLDLRL